MSYFNWTDVNATTELIWESIKYFTVNPNCWFSSYDFDAIDLSGDNDLDSIQADIAIQSVLPYDKVKDI